MDKCAKVLNKDLATRKTIAAPAVFVLPTKAALDFRAEQAKKKQIFEAKERQNTEFIEAVATHTSYPKKYTLPSSYEICLDLLGSENPIYERRCVHGHNCHRINKCGCTSDEICKLRDEFRKAQDDEVKRLEKLEKKKSNNNADAETNTKDDLAAKIRDKERKKFEKWQEEHF